MNDFDSIFSDSSQFQELLIIDANDSKTRKSKFDFKPQYASDDRDPLLNLSQQIREVKLELLREENELDVKEYSEGRDRKTTTKPTAKENNLTSRQKHKTEEKTGLQKDRSKKNSIQKDNMIRPFIRTDQYKKGNSSVTNTVLQKAKMKQESLLQKVARKLKVIKDAQDVHENKIKLLNTPLEHTGTNLLKKSKESNIFKPTDTPNNRTQSTEQAIPKTTNTERYTRPRDRSRDVFARSTIIPHDHRRKVDQVRKDGTYEKSRGLDKPAPFRDRSTRRGKNREKISEQCKVLPNKMSNIQTKSSPTKQTDILEIFKVRDISSTTVVISEKSESIAKDYASEVLDAYDFTKRTPHQNLLKNIMDYYTPIVPKQERIITKRLEAQYNKEATETPTKMKTDMLHHIFIPANLEEMQKEIDHTNKVIYNVDMPVASRVTHEQKYPLQVPKESGDIYKAIDKIILSAHKYTLLSATTEGFLNTGPQVKLPTPIQTKKDGLGKSGVQKKETDTFDKIFLRKDIQKLEPTSKINNENLKPLSSPNKESKFPERGRPTMKVRELSTERAQRLGSPVKIVTTSPLKTHSVAKQRSASPNRGRESLGKGINTKGAQKSGGESPSRVTNPKINSRSTSHVYKARRESSNNTSGVQRPKTATNDRIISPERKSVSPNTTQLVRKTNEVPQNHQYTVIDKIDKKLEETINNQQNNLNIKNNPCKKVEAQTSQAAQNAKLYPSRIMELNRLIKEKSPEILKICNALLNNEHIKAHLNEHKQNKIYHRNIAALPFRTETDVDGLCIEPNKDSPNIKIKLSANLLQNLRKIKDEALKIGIISSKSELEVLKNNNVNLNSEIKNIIKETIKLEDVKGEKDDKSNLPKNKTPQEQPARQNVAKSGANNYDLKKIKSTRSKSSPPHTDQKNVTDGVNIDLKKCLALRSNSPDNKINQENDTKQISKSDGVKIDIKETKSKNKTSEEKIDQKNITKQVTKSDGPNITTMKANQIKSRSTSPAPVHDQQNITQHDLNVDENKCNGKEIKIKKSNHIYPRHRSLQRQSDQQKFTNVVLKAEEAKIDEQGNKIKPIIVAPRSKSVQPHSNQQNFAKVAKKTEAEVEKKEIKSCKDLARNKDGEKLNSEVAENKSHEIVNTHISRPKSRSISPKCNINEIKSRPVSTKAKSPQPQGTNKVLKNDSPKSKTPPQIDVPIQTKEIIAQVESKSNVRKRNKSHSSRIRVSERQTVNKPTTEPEQNKSKPEISPISKSPQQQIDQQLTNKDLKDNENRSKSPTTKSRRSLIRREVKSRSRSFSPELEVTLKTSDEALIKTQDYTKYESIENSESLENVMQKLNNCAEEDMHEKETFFEQMKKHDETLQGTLNRIKSREKQTEQLLQLLPKRTDSKCNAITKLSAIPLKPITDDKYIELTMKKKDDLSPIDIIPSEDDLERQEKRSLIQRISEMESLRAKLVKQLSEKHVDMDLNNDVLKIQQKCRHLQKDNKMLERRLISFMQQNFEKIDDVRDHLRYLTKQENDIVSSYRDLQSKIPEIYDLQNENNKVLKQLSENPSTLEPGSTKKLKEELRTLSNKKICLESDLFKLNRDQEDLQDRLQYKKRIDTIERAEMETGLRKLEAVLQNTKDANHKLEKKYEEVLKKIKHESMFEIDKIKKLESCMKDLTERYKRLADEKKELETTNGILKRKLTAKQKEANKYIAENQDTNDQHTAENQDAKEK